MYIHIYIKEIILFILPLFIAGLLHHFFIVKYNLFAFFAKPIDFGLTFNNKRLLGNSKTFRGFIIMTIVTAIFVWLLNSFLNIPLKYNAFISGALLGFGYSLGELPNSFLKRRLTIKESVSASEFPGKLFSILDQTDSIIGALIFLTIIYSPSIALTVTLFLTGTLLHIIVDISLCKFSYKKNLKRPVFTK